MQLQQQDELDEVKFLLETLRECNSVKEMEALIQVWRPKTRSRME